MKMLILGVAAVTAALVTPAAATETINFGVQPATQPIYIAKAAGYLDKIESKYDVKFAFKTFSYGAPENQAMASGAIQMASAGMGPAIVAAARLPAKLLAISILEQTAIIVPADSKITTVAGLKGKTVAYPGKGSQQYPLLIKALQDAGLKESDITLFKTKGSDVAKLIKTKSVDAGITWDPHVSAALADGSAKVLIKAEKILPIKEGHYIGNGVYAREEFVKSHPKLVQEVVNALVKAIDLIKKQPQKAIDMWVAQIGFPRGVIEYSLKEKISIYSTDIVPYDKTIKSYTAFLKEAKILKASDTPKVDATFAEQAKAMF